MDRLATYEQNLAVRKLAKEANQRLQERIIGFNLLRGGKAGADEYLQKFGRGISAAKCAALAVACTAYAEKNEALCGLSAEETRRCLMDFARKFQEQVELLGGLQ
jgi:hypothetical protein